MPRGFPPKPYAERFRLKYYTDESGCWLWNAHVDRNGYGTFRIGSRTTRSARMEVAHRVSWTIFRGPIPTGMHVLHRCDVRHCVNPDHLFLGTNADNVADKMAKGRHVSPPPERNGGAIYNLAKTHCPKGHPYDEANTYCPKGHPYDEANTYRQKDGGRACKACSAARALRYYYSHKRTA